MKKSSLVEKLSSLNEDELTIIYLKLLEDIEEDRPFVLTEEDLLAKQDAEREIVEKFIEAYDIEDTEYIEDAGESMGKNFLIQLTQVNSHYQDQVEEYLHELQNTSITLGMTDTNLTILIIAIAAAIIRPHFSFLRKENEILDQEREKEMRIELQLKGIDDIVNLIKNIKHLL